jgi:hypothetical protein
VLAAQVSGGARELRQPGFVVSWNRQRQQCPGGLGAHGCDVRQVHREGPMTDRGRWRTDWKMRAFHQRIGDQHEFARRRWHDHRAVIADTDPHVHAVRAQP